MVVDMELENAKKNVLELMKTKDEIEAEIQQHKTVLNNNNVGMNDSLVDSEGFPRSDIDVYQIRHARHKIICLSNDYKVLMNKIAQGLLQVLPVDGAADQNIDSPAKNHSEEASELDVDDVFGDPFLRVNLVTSGSPAEQAGIRLNDLIVEFGSINSQNFKQLKDVGDLVQQSRYKEVMVKIKRPEMNKSIVISLIPKPWSGKGLLGCNILPIESVER